jgi:hypothetical protein
MRSISIKSRGSSCQPYDILKAVLLSIAICTEAKNSRNLNSYDIYSSASLREKGRCNDMSVFCS